MRIEKFTVVFDTNSYRNFVRGHAIDAIEANVARLKEQEAQKNINAIATPVVGLELLGNLSGPRDSLRYEECLKALVAMANHCYDPTENTLRLVPHPYVHLTRNFFHISIPELEQTSSNMIGVVGDFKYDYLKAIEGIKLTHLAA